MHFTVPITLWVIKRASVYPRPTPSQGKWAPETALRLHREGDWDWMRWVGWLAARSLSAQSCPLLPGPLALGTQSLFPLIVYEGTAKFKCGKFKPPTGPCSFEVVSLLSIWKVFHLLTVFANPMRASWPTAWGESKAVHMAVEGLRLLHPQVPCNGQHSASPGGDTHGHTESLVAFYAPFLFLWRIW